MASLLHSADHYATLGLTPDATDREIEQAFRSRMLDHMKHPEISEAPQRERAKQLSTAYETLSDRRRREEYDAGLGLVSRPVRSGAPEGAGNQSGSFILNEARGQSTGPVSGDDSLEERLFRETPSRRGAKHLSLGGRESHSYGQAGQPDHSPRHPRHWSSVVPLLGFLSYRSARDGEDDAAQARTDVSAFSGAPAFEHDADGSGSGSSYADESATDAESSGPKRKGLAAALVVGAAVAAIVLGFGVFAPQSPEDNRGQGSSPAERAIAGADQALAGANQNPNVPITSTSTAIAGMSQEQMAEIPPLDERSFQVPAVSPGPEKGPTAVAAGSKSEGTAAKASQAAASPSQSGSMVPVPQPATNAGPSSNAASTRVANAPVQPIAPSAVVPVPRRQVERIATPARWVSGGILDSDNPGGDLQGTVSVRFTVDAKGGVTGCRPIVSSRDPKVDAVTCGLVEQRLRFKPALDSAGRPLATEIRTTYSWGRRRRR